VLTAKLLMKEGDGSSQIICLRFSSKSEKLKLHHTASKGVSLWNSACGSHDLAQCCSLKACCYKRIWLLLDLIRSLQLYF
jgi:hypothetical protein